MSRAPAASPLLRHPPFAAYVWAQALAELASQIGVVAVGWQVYALTRSPLCLGLIGLAQFLPTAALALLAGPAADRFDRRRIVGACRLLEAAAAAVLAWVALAGRLNAGEIFATVALFGAAAAFESPAAAALLSAAAPEGRLQTATALATGALQAAAIAGPALGGLIYALAPGAPYAVMAVLWLLAAALNAAMPPARAPGPAATESRLDGLFAGVGFIRRNPLILGALSLDLFAVLLGGATALLPILASDILHAGPWALGLLRGAPAIGAVAAAAVLARWPLERRVGERLFQAVIVFGLATVAFALSRSVWLSVLALIVLGAADTVSMVIRIALVQLSTPDALRGRVGAVNFLFVGASYQLGEFESGIAAALLGAAPAALLGGLGTVAVALIWMRLFPALREAERLEQHDQPEAPADQTA